MGVSMVIAAWGEGVNVCLCPPSPSRIARRALKTREKNRWLGSSDASPLAARVPAPPRLINRKGQKYSGGSFSCFHTHVCDSTHPLVFNWLNN